MSYDEIMTFLTVVEHSNIAKAANQLYISQGTASTRIHHLEEELDITLFYRQKGVKGVSLTPDGELFLPIAQQWISLCREAKHLKEMKIFKELRIAASDMFNRFLFIDIYKQFMSKNPNILLTIQTEHSTEIHQLIENQQMDLGFVYGLHNFPNVFSKPLYQEDMVFICHKTADFAHSGNISDLKPENEIYLRWSSAFNLWHRQYFPQTNLKKVTLGTVSMLPSFLEDETAWSIVSRSIANILVRRMPDFQCFDISSPPPKRTAYILFHKHAHPWIQEISQQFLQEIIESVKENPALTLLLDKLE